MKDPAVERVIVEGLDTQRGLSMTGGTPEGYWAVLEVYRRDGGDRLKILDSYGDGASVLEDPLGFTIQVHALKSASASIGAMDLAGLAADLEAAGKKGDWEFIRENLGEFRRVLGLTLDRIDEALRNRTAPRSRDAAPDSGFGPGGGETGELLRALRAALAAENIRDIDRFIQDLEALPPLSGSFRKAVEEISDNVLISEFQAAIAAIDALLGG
ncbi:MAG: Hpt domain-containing protein [Treponema sp.]|nr:Hpt domain-containing protein [Treponema sp.]